MTARPTPTGHERQFDREEIIVSKTDLSGRITYANDIFLKISGYTEAEIIGQPHSTIRHPDMPRCVFQLLWKTIQKGQEIFAYVVNLAKNGDHYWVYAHVTPTFGSDGAIVGFHSNRRCPDTAALDKIRPLYAALLAAEKDAASKADAIAKSEALLVQLLGQNKVRYDQFVFAL
jgi:PAS domain S-box-containing protein